MMKALLSIVLITVSINAAGAEPEKRQLLEKMFAVAGIEASDRETVAAYDAALSAGELKAAIAFFETPAGKHLSATMRATWAASLERAVQAEAQKRTFSDVLTLATAVEMFATDYDAYPDALTFDDLAKQLQPDYIRTMRRADGWGREFLYLSHLTEYRIVSAGPDGRLAEGSRVLDARGPFGDDVVFENGEFVSPAAAREWIEAIRAK